MEWMILPLRRYAQFSGRSQRKEYWMFILFNFIVSIAFNIIDSLLGLGGHVTDYTAHGASGFAAGAYSRGGVLSSLWSLAILVPAIAVGVRRLHDIDRSGWWFLAPVVLIAIGAILMVATMTIPGLLLFGLGGIGGIVLFVWVCMDGTRGANRFGPDPKGMTNDLADTFS